MSILRSVGGKDGPENGSARFKECYRLGIGRSPMMGRGGTLSSDHFRIADVSISMFFHVSSRAVS